jgi:hypothetical protein
MMSAIGRLKECYDPSGNFEEADLFKGEPIVEPSRNLGECLANYGVPY